MSRSSLGLANPKQRILQLLMLVLNKCLFRIHLAWVWGGRKGVIQTQFSAKRGKEFGGSCNFRLWFWPASLRFQPAMVWPSRVLHILVVGILKALLMLSEWQNPNTALRIPHYGTRSTGWAIKVLINSHTHINRWLCKDVGPIKLCLMANVCSDSIGHKKCINNNQQYSSQPTLKYLAKYLTGRSKSFLIRNRTYW